MKITVGRQKPLYLYSCHKVQSMAKVTQTFRNLDDSYKHTAKNNPPIPGTLSLTMHAYTSLTRTFIREDKGKAVPQPN